MKKYQKLLSMALSVVLCAGLFTACGGQPGDTPSSSPASTPSGTPSGAGEPAAITIWHTRPESDEPTSDHQRILSWAKNFNETNTDSITVEVVGSKKDDSILTAIASGTTPDVFMGYWNTTSTWAANGALLDLTNFINNDAAFEKDDFAQIGWDQASFDGKIWGVPFIMNTTLLYYRADLLTEAGFSEPPKTLEELKKMAIDLTKYDSNGDIVQAGFIPDYPWLDNVCWPVMTGAQWIDPATNTITFDSPAMKEAYQWQADICSTIGYDKLVKFKDGFGTRDTAEDPLVTGKVAMTFFSEKKINPLEEVGKDVEWKVCALPHSTSNAASASEVMLTTNQFKINANTAHPEQAWKVLASLCSKDSMKSYAEGEYNQGAFFARKSAVEAVKSIAGISQPMIDTADIMLSGSGRGFPNSAYVNEYLNIIAENMSLALSGDMTVDEAAKSVNDTVQPLADKAPVK